MKNCNFCVKCKGRNSNQEEVLKKPVKAIVTPRQRSGSNLIIIDVECPHVGGGHGGNCLASGSKGVCAYSIDLPHHLSLNLN